VNEAGQRISAEGQNEGRLAAKVLVVEDELVLRLLIELSLTKAGCTVHGAASAEEALPIWQEHGSQIDLLVTDVALPGPMDGLGLIRRLRADRPMLRIICTTGSGGDRITLGPNEGERPEVVIKPYESADLVAAVRRVLGGEGGR
jgi:two-component system cell cycle sensor histidine kinase/response regulator CckA